MAENIRQIIFDDSEKTQLNDNQLIISENNNVDCLNTDVILDSINVEENIEIQEEIVLTHAEEEEEVKFHQEAKQSDICEENHVVIVETCKTDESKELIERNRNVDPEKGLPKGTHKIRTPFSFYLLKFRQSLFREVFWSCVTMAAKHCK